MPLQQLTEIVEKLGFLLHSDILFMTHQDPLNQCSTDFSYQ